MHLTREGSRQRGKASALAPNPDRAHPHPASGSNPEAKLPSYASENRELLPQEVLSRDQPRPERAPPRWEGGESTNHETCQTPALEPKGHGSGRSQRFASKAGLVIRQRVSRPGGG